MSSSPNQLVIELIVRDQAGNVVKSLDANLKNLDQTAKKVKQDLQQTGEGAAQGAQKGEEGLRSMFHTADIGGVRMRDLSHAMIGAFAGVDTAILAMDGKVDAATQHMLQLGKAAEHVALAFAFGGSVGGALALIGVGVGLMVGRMKELEQQVTDARKPFEDLKASIDALGQSADPLARSFEKISGVSKEVGEAFAAAAHKSKEFRQELSDLADLETRMATLGVTIKQLSERISVLPESTVKDALVKQYNDDIAALTKLSAAHDREVTALTNEASAMGADAASAVQYNMALLGILSTQGKLQSAISTTTRAFTDSAEQLDARRRALASNNDEQNALAVSLANVTFQDQQNTLAAQANAKALAAQAAAAQKLVDVIKGMVDKAITPSAVTPEDMAATKAGKYVDKWDEFRRRAEAVAQGTPAGQFGPQFEAQLKGLGMSAEQAAQGFKDFSLFADPKNLNLINWGPIVADVQHQIDMLIGKANVAKEAFDQVWAALSPTKKASLAEALGLDASQANNAQKVFQAMSGDSSEKSAKLTSEIAQNIQKIEGIHTAIIDVVKSGTFDANLKQILDDLAKIPAEADVVVTITYQTAAGTGMTGLAAGGPVQAGQAYLVGEAGPEMFMPNSGGQIINNKLMKQIMDMGRNLFTPGLRDSLKNIGDVDAWLNANYGALMNLYNLDPQMWMGIAGQHHWSHWDWFQFLENLFSPLGKGALGGGGGGGTPSPAPADQYGHTFNFYVQNSNDGQTWALMSQVRALAAHRA